MFNPKYWNALTFAASGAAQEVPCGVVDEFGAEVTPNVVMVTPIHATALAQVTVGPAAGTGGNVGKIVITLDASVACDVMCFFAKISNPND